MNLPLTTSIHLAFLPLEMQKKSQTGECIAHVFFLLFLKRND